jgi:hypothetical protein
MDITVGEGVLEPVEDRLPLAKPCVDGRKRTARRSGDILNR